MPESERYQYLRERKRCACCGKQDDRTLAGFAYCEPCAEKARKRYNADKYKELNKQKRIENFAMLYEMQYGGSWICNEVEEV